jgi:lysine biosynthesis protein LysW
MAKAVCPACKARLDLDRHIEDGDFFNCFRCGVDLEVISLHPLILDWADDGTGLVGMTRHWQGGAKRSKRDKKKRTKARTREYWEFDYVD